MVQPTRVTMAEPDTVEPDQAMKPHLPIELDELYAAVESEMVFGTNMVGEPGTASELDTTVGPNAAIETEQPNEPTIEPDITIQLDTAVRLEPYLVEFEDKGDTTEVPVLVVPQCKGQGLELLQDVPLFHLDDSERTNEVLGPEKVSKGPSLMQREDRELCALPHLRKWMRERRAQVGELKRELGETHPGVEAWVIPMLSGMSRKVWMENDMVRRVIGDSDGRECGRKRARRCKRRLRRMSGKRFRTPVDGMRCYTVYSDYGSRESYV